MSSVTVIGGGFSGLSTAYYLTTRGIPCRVVEREQRLGGLIETQETEHGPVEMAANAVLNSRRAEELFQGIGLELCFPRPISKARYIFRGKPRRWPLSVGESLSTLGHVTKTFLTRRTLSAAESESVADWGSRVVGKGATHFLLAPALQGIYGTDSLALSAGLVVPKRSKDDRPKKRGIAAPPRGMGDLIQGLRTWLESKGVNFETGVEADVDPGQGWTLVCTSAQDAAGLLKDIAPETSERLQQIHPVSLLKATVFYQDADGLDGFGVLFPKPEGFHSLGVLFNTNIFENRGSLRSETWIMNAEAQGARLDSTDQEIIDAIAQDRKKLTGKHVDPVSVHIKRWPSALPRYDTHLEGLIRDPFQLPDRVLLVGNYLGGIGLSKLLVQAEGAAQRVAEG